VRWSWYAAAPGPLGTSRLSLDFDLRAADRRFREIVVPGLGRVWFVRQLSWPLAALALHERLAPSGGTLRPTAICHGIEALACKVEFHRRSGEDRSRRLLGTRAFGRDSGLQRWSFEELRRPAYYVRNTHRQLAVRALRLEGGLGLASGPRFDRYRLEEPGRELAEAFLQQPVGNGRLETWLTSWLRGARDGDPGTGRTLVDALSPETPSPEERRLTRGRVLDTAGENGTRRMRLADALGRARDMPNVEDHVVPRLRRAGHPAQADQVLAALAFGAMLDRARDTASELTRLVEAGKGERVDRLASEKTVRGTLKALRTAAARFEERLKTARLIEPDASRFARDVVASDDMKVLSVVVHRSGGLLILAEGVVHPGPLFQVIDGALGSVGELDDASAEIEPDRTARTFRISNLHSLLRDISGSAGS